MGKGRERYIENLEDDILLLFCKLQDEHEDVFRELVEWGIPTVLKAGIKSGQKRRPELLPEI